MKTETIIPEDDYTVENEEYENQDFTELHEPSFDEPYNWEELMEDVETRKTSQDSGVGLEYLARLEDDSKAEDYLT
ncbi:MAG: hypothetical protein ACI8Z7_000576 [Candidatus Nanohaloarchaea archaeon]|jgi:hypothetical protein